MKKISLELVIMLLAIVALAVAAGAPIIW